MAATNDATVNAFYLAYYGRPADPAGLAYWSAALAQSNGDFSSIISAFSTSAEATAHFNSASTSDYIADVYQQLFGRAPDAAGLAYWTSAIANGDMTLADAAIQIMHGAQSTDAQVSTLRQDAAAQFTAAVAASGVDYDGTAAVEAARVLIAAVTTTSSAADISALVTASASLVQTVHDNPAILTALEGGADLSTLLSTSSGKADPVALVQALASIGKAALTDSAGLTTLLHGDGVAGLLASLPSGTSLSDVATAVSTGGLAAGAAVADPTPVATTPVATGPTIAFVGPDGHDLPTGTTLVSNSIYYFVDVHGAAKGATLTFQVSDTGQAGTWTNASEDTTLSNGVHYIRYQSTSTSGTTTTSNALKLVMDSTLASPGVHLTEDTGASSTDNVSSKGEVTISGLHANETWTYSLDGGKTWTAGAAADVNGDATVADAGAGTHSLLVRTLETVNGQSQFTSTEYNYAVDTSVAGTIALTSHAGAEVTTNDAGLVFTTVLAPGQYNDVTTTYEVSTSGLDGTFTTWTAGQALDDGTYYFRGDLVDKAGNTAVTNIVTVHLDNVAPATPTVQLVADTGASATDGITYNGEFTVSGLEQGGTWKYSLDGTHWYSGGAIGTDGTATAYAQSGAQTVQVISVDAAGNESGAASLQVTVDYHVPAENLKFDHVEGGSNLGNSTAQTALAHPDVVFSYTGTVESTDTVAYSIDNGAHWVTLDASAVDANAKTITIADLDVSTSDVAVQLHVTSVSGMVSGAGEYIEGPYVTYYANSTAAGIEISNPSKTASVYLTDGGNASVKVGDVTAYDTATIGVQDTAVQGVLGVGPSTTVHNVSGIDTEIGTTYALGTNGADTLTGMKVWGYDGDDVITAVANPNDYNFATIYGGAGSDQIHSETASSRIYYNDASESAIVADTDTTALAHGFDTVYLGSTASTSQQLYLGNTTLTDENYNVSATGYTGNETGAQLTALLNNAVAGVFQAASGVHAALIDFGVGTDGNDVNFLFVDTNGDSTVDAGDYIVKLVGTIDHAGFSHGNGSLVLIN